MATPLTPTPTPTSPAAQVLVDASLFRHIVGFQHGQEMALLALWRAHKPASEPLRLDRKTIRALMELLVEHGTLDHVRKAERARWWAKPNSCSFSSTGDKRVILHQLSLEHVADMAFKRNRIDIALWALESKCSKVVFPLLHEYAPLRDKWEMDRVAERIAVDLDHMSVLRFLLNVFPQMSAWPFMVTLAAAHGDLPTLQRLHARNVMAPLDKSRISVAMGLRPGNRFGCVVSPRRLDILAFLLEHFDQHLHPSDLVELASNTHPEINQVVRRFAEKLQGACVESMNRGEVRLEQVQQWVATRILSPQWPISIDTIASHGLLDMVRLLHEHGIATATTDAMDQAAWNGKWDVVEFLHFHRSEGCTTRPMDAALLQANLKYVLFLREHRTEGCSPQAVEMAASNPATATLRFMHAHAGAQFTPAVLDAAAACGNLAAVKFLHENRSEGCTTAAIDKAANGGHLRVIRYLHAHRFEGCTFAALSGAIQSGKPHVVRFLFDNYRHLFECSEFDEDLVTKAVTFGLGFSCRRDIVELLFDHFPHLFAPQLLQKLLVRGMFDMYQALRSRIPSKIIYRDVTEDMIIESALQEAGRTFELRTVRFIVKVLGRRDLAHVAMDGAASGLHCGTHWLRAVYAITGPQSCRLSAVQMAVQVAVGRRCSLDRVKFLIRACCEPNAKQAAIERIPPRSKAALAAELASWDPTADDVDTKARQQPLHPFLLDPRVKSHGNTTDTKSAGLLFSFEGARAAAIHANSLKALQWLLTNVDLPVEPTLLDEALFYDRREIAEWLVEHHPEACTKVQWETTHRENYMNRFYVSEDLLNWLEATPAVRNALDFGGIFRYLMQQNGAESLRRLHAFDPALVVSQPSLATLANQSNGTWAEDFLREIGYPNA